MFLGSSLVLCSPVVITHYWLYMLALVRLRKGVPRPLKGTSGHWDDRWKYQEHRWCFPESHQWQGRTLKGTGKLTWLTGGSETGAVGGILVSLITDRFTQHQAYWQQIETSCLKKEKRIPAYELARLIERTFRFKEERGYNQAH